MSHVATYLTTFNNTEFFLKALEKGRTELGFDQIKKITIQKDHHYQIFLKDQEILINFIWNKSSYEASVDLKDWQQKYSFEALLRNLYSFYIVEILQSQKEGLNLNRIVKNESSTQTTLNLIQRVG